MEALRASKATIRCQDMIDYLESPGFEIRDGSKQSRKIVGNSKTAFHIVIPAQAGIHLTVPKGRMDSGLRRNDKKALSQCHWRDSNEHRRAGG